MDNKAFYKLTYGVFLLSVNDNGTKNACIINTCIQVASSPFRIAFSCINNNYTTELLKKSGKFTISFLDSKSKFETIKHFGLQSGRSIDKFNNFEHKLTESGVPYIEKDVCAMLEGNVVSASDLKSHTLFIAEVLDAKVLNSNPPLTYADYQDKIKPKLAKPLDNSKKIVGYKCKICGYVYNGSTLPNDFICPLCGHSASDFEPIYE